MSSIAASTTRSTSFMLSFVISTKPVRRPIAASLSACVIFSLATSFVRLLSIFLTPPSINSCLMSFKITSQPCVKNTCAIPEPIVPAPMTITFLQNMFNSSFKVISFTSFTKKKRTKSENYPFTVISIPLPIKKSILFIRKNRFFHYFYIPFLKEFCKTYDSTS